MENRRARAVMDDASCRRWSLGAVATFVSEFFPVSDVSSGSRRRQPRTRRVFFFFCRFFGCFIFFFFVVPSDDGGNHEIIGLFRRRPFYSRHEKRAPPGENEILLNFVTASVFTRHTKACAVFFFYIFQVMYPEHHLPGTNPRTAVGRHPAAARVYRITVMIMTIIIYTWREGATPATFKWRRGGSVYTLA